MFQEVDAMLELTQAEVSAFRARVEKQPAFEKVLLKAKLDDVVTASLAVK